MTKISVSTHWIAHRHTDGSAMIDEINNAGFTSVELGYDTLPHLVPGIEKAVAEKRIACRSLHNYCPVPDAYSEGHPELFSLSSLDAGDRQSAVYHTCKTIEFAACIGAEAVVSHAGNVQMPRFTERLAKLYNRNKSESRRYDRIRANAAVARKTPAIAHFNALCLSLEELLPEAEKQNVKLAFENLPSLEAIPTLEEQEALFEKYPSPYLCYWHDFGHAQVMQNMRIAPHFYRLQRFKERTAGVHIHDTCGIEDAHIMPPVPDGIHWDIPRNLLHPEWRFVLEPKPGTPVHAVQAAVEYLQATWQL